MAEEKNNKGNDQHQRYLLGLILIGFLISAGVLSFMFKDQLGNNRNNSNNFGNTITGAFAGTSEISSDSDSFKFVVASDVPNKRNIVILPSHTQNAVSSIQKLTNPKVELVMFTGDMIGGGDRSGNAELNIPSIDEDSYKGVVVNMWNYFIAAVYTPLTSEGMLFFPVPGSQDVAMNHPEILSPLYEEIWTARKPNAKIEGNYPYYYYFNYKNSHFIVLNTAVHKIDANQLMWLNNDLERVSEDKKIQNIFIFSHTPIEPFCSNPQCAYLLEGKTELTQILKKHSANKNMVFFSGNSQVYYKASYNSINTVSVGGLAGTFDLLHVPASSSLEEEKLMQELKQTPSFVVVDVQGEDVRVGAVTDYSDSGVNFDDPFVENFKPMPNYDVYHELTKNPVLSKTTINPMPSSGIITPPTSTGNEKMDRWDHFIMQECKGEENERECFAIIKTTMYIESKGNDKAVSSTGCSGLMQFCADTAKGSPYNTVFNSGTIGKANDDRFDGIKSIKAAKLYLIDGMKKQRKINNIFFIYIGYNAGPGHGSAADKHFSGKIPSPDEIITWINQQGFSEGKKNELITSVLTIKKMYSIYLGQTLSSVSYPDAFRYSASSSTVQKINAPSDITYHITPSFTVDLEYDMAIYSKIKEYIRWYVKKTESCNNAGYSLLQCSEESLKMINQEPFFSSSIGMIKDCTEDESPEEKIYYDLVEQLKACSEQEFGKICRIHLMNKLVDKNHNYDYRITISELNNKLNVSLISSDSISLMRSQGYDDTVNRKSLLLAENKGLDIEAKKLSQLDIIVSSSNGKVKISYKTEDQAQDETNKEIIDIGELYVIPDSVGNLRIINPAVANSVVDMSDIFTLNTEQQKQTARKLCIESKSAYSDIFKVLLKTPLTYRFSVGFDKDARTVENFLDPMPTFVDRDYNNNNSSILTLQQLQKLMLGKTITVFGDSLAVEGAEENGFISLLKNKIPSAKYKVYGKDTISTWLKDNTLQNDILLGEHDVLIITIGTNEVCNDESFALLLHNIKIITDLAKASNNDMKIIVVGLPPKQSETCRRNTIIFNAFINKKDKLHEKIIKQITDEQKKEFELTGVDIGLDIFPDTAYEDEVKKFAYYHNSFEKRLESDIILPSKEKIHQVIADMIIDQGLRGLQLETNNLQCKKIFVLGTSSTAHGYVYDWGFINQLKKKFSGKIEFDGAGYSSESSKQVLTHFKEDILINKILPNKFDCLVVWAGLNDIGSAKGAWMKVKDNLAQIYDLAHENNIKVIAMELQPAMPESVKPVQYENVNLLNKWIISEANVEARVPLYNLLEDSSAHGRMKNEFLTVDKETGEIDLLHPNQNGHTIIAEQIEKNIITFNKQPALDAGSPVMMIDGSSEYPCQPGVDIIHSTNEEKGTQTFIVDPAKCKIELISGKTVHASQGYKVASVDSMRSSVNAPLAVNGGFFNMKTAVSVGLFIENGIEDKYEYSSPLFSSDKVKSEYGNWYFVIDKDNKVAIVKTLPSKESIAYARETHLIVKNGIPITVENCPFPNSNFCGSPKRPRTGVCLTDNYQLKFVLSKEMSVPEFAEYLADKEKCKDGLNFDGGGSTQAHYKTEDEEMHIKVREPSDNSPHSWTNKGFRQVSDAFIVKGLIKQAPLQPVAKKSSNSVTFFVIGDQGSGGKQQKKTAGAIKKQCDIADCDFGITVGDNIYFTPTSNMPVEKIFQTVLGNPYSVVTRKNSDNRIPIYLVPGNHDYSNGGKAWINYIKKMSKETDWLKFPVSESSDANYYSFKAGPALFINLDGRYKGRNDLYSPSQSEWAVSQFKSTDATWVITANHYPFETIGKYTFPGNPNGRLGKIICGNVDLHMAGHDHTKQFFSHPKCKGYGAGKELFSLIGGTSGDSMYPFKNTKQTKFLDGHKAASFDNLFAFKTYGFILIKIEGNDMYISYYDNDNKMEKTFRLQKNQKGEVSVISVNGVLADASGSLDSSDISGDEELDENEQISNAKMMIEDFLDYDLLERMFEESPSDSEIADAGLSMPDYSSPYDDVYYEHSEDDTALS